MVSIRENQGRSIRNLPITAALKHVLTVAGDAAGIDAVEITSGGQPSSGPHRTGSHRHDNGNAADLDLRRNGALLDFTRSADQPIVARFVKAAVASGATGVGAGVGYMGPTKLHIGFGSEAVWGAGGQRANAPGWLVGAFEEGLRLRATGGWVDTAASLTGARLHRVIARGGLRLRGGPGTEFPILSTLASGTELSVLGFEGADGAWARVDIEGDGQADGHVLASFLAAVLPVVNPQTGLLADAYAATEANEEGGVLV